MTVLAFTTNEEDTYRNLPDVREGKKAAENNKGQASRLLREIPLNMLEQRSLNTSPLQKVFVAGHPARGAQGTSATRSFAANATSDEDPHDLGASGLISNGHTSSSTSDVPNSTNSILNGDFKELSAPRVPQSKSGEPTVSHSQERSSHVRDLPLRTPSHQNMQHAVRPECEVDALQVRRRRSPVAIDSGNTLQNSDSALDIMDTEPRSSHISTRRATSMAVNGTSSNEQKRPRNLTIDTSPQTAVANSTSNTRPTPLPRALSTPAGIKSQPTPQIQYPGTRQSKAGARVESPEPTSRCLTGSKPLPSPMPPSLPLPPMSIPIYLQLELSSQRPSTVYIHRSVHTDFPYESSRAKIERLLNFLFLPLYLEGVLWFGTVACLDAWLYTFTILPLRLAKSFCILGQSWLNNLRSEVHFVSSFVFRGSGRMWSRQWIADVPSPSKRNMTPLEHENEHQTNGTKPKGKTDRHHQRTKSVPSTLLPDNKADILKGLLIICTCAVLLRLDASRMYHWVRGQAAIKLYVIYNVLEVCDRLLSAIGQDVLECLFSQEALERKPDGHSKVLRPFWLFMLALAYTITHSTALFYQVVTLNVAVNSYSNALITLLMSNQFVEIKSTVFKKFEKENLFQLTCADIVERFQLWHMLLIIAARNVVETGGLNMGLNAMSLSLKSAASTASAAFNSTSTFAEAVPPRSVSSILPQAFTMVPAVISSMTSYIPIVGTVLGPFLVVLGSEMVVDWIKHAYINKFNNTRPAIYGRFLDVLAKDYYTNAFGDQNLSKRLGLPIIPLSCLMIRASFQTYHMFLASWVPAPSSGTTANLASIQQQYATLRVGKPATTAAAISRTFDNFLNQIPSIITSSTVATHLTSILVVLLVFLILLACKLVLGMLLLSFARSRYRSMKEREHQSVQHVEGGRRVGGWGVVEVDEDKKRWIYEDDPAGFQTLKEREAKEKAKQDKEKRGFSMEAFDKIRRYDMVAKRIW